jgi:hypothetical protein
MHTRGVRCTGAVLPEAVVGLAPTAFYTIA